MRPKHLIIGGVLLLCVAAGVFVFLKLHGSSAAAPDESADENATTIISVQVGALTNITLHRYVTGYGTVEPAPAIAARPAAGGALAAPSAGIVANINVVAGQPVQKGEVLMQLNSATATFDYAKAELERQRKLFAQQNTSRKNLEDAAAQLASLEVIAPVSGTVTSVNVQPGQAVDATTTVAEVIDLDRLALSVNIPAAQAGQLQAGEQLQIESEPPATASLSFVSATVDPADGTVRAWAMLSPACRLRPGEFVPVKIVTEVKTNCLAAPARSVVTDDTGASAIWLVNDNHASRTAVRIGLQDEDWTEVNAPGLKPAEPVVTIGAYGLPDKTQIKIVNETNSPAAQ
ncbi:MAG TPA: efflux RND transporter periplasmic adaptor subunit, partial [Verrucomicrobiae bacterium]|nr:efflux RND transporter periplasmic adaptor subunit [Verrucomicrobiae bacterium]